MCFLISKLIAKFDFGFGYGVVLRALPFAGRTCRTRETSRTFDFQEVNAFELRACQISWISPSAKHAIFTLKVTLVISWRIALCKVL
jgi:hypothetical protein